MKTKQANRGVTLVEIAIVLVVIGFLLGGILKAQELISNAKIRAIIEQQNSLKVAWYAFIDRYQIFPGDSTTASKHVIGAGNGDGDGVVREEESPLVFQHLTGAGYLRCSQCTATTTVKPAATNSLQNEYGGIMSIWADSQHYAVLGAVGPTAGRLAVHTGPRIPSNVITEVERKLDDGIANSGSFVFSAYDPSLPVGGRQPSLDCMTTKVASQVAPVSLAFSNVLYWRHASARPPVEQNCGGAFSIWNQ